MPQFLLLRIELTILRLALLLPLFGVTFLLGLIPVFVRTADPVPVGLEVLDCEVVLRVRTLARMEPQRSESESMRLV